MYRKDISLLFIRREDSIQQAVGCIDKNVCGIALVVDEQQRLLGTITDGDIRRALLAGIDLRSPVDVLLERKSSSIYPHPITAPSNSDAETLLKRMLERSIRQVPLIDHQGRVTDIVLLTDLLPADDLPVQAVIMAGGYGTRLRPLTNDTPKPLLPVGDQPIMELMIEQLRASGIHHIHVTTHYLADRVKEYFGDGEALGVDLKYVTEDSPLGTAGALGLIPPAEDPLLVINGDILTRLNFRAMLDFHRGHNAELTVAVRQYGFQVPYGVVECNGPQVISLEEKPSYNFFVNAGIYMVQPSALAHIPPGQQFHMTDLITSLVSKGQSVVSFPIVEYWLDIGQAGDYEQALKDVKEGRFTVELGE